MAQVLEMFHLLDQNRMAEMQIRCRWIKTSLDLERFSAFSGFL